MKEPSPLILKKACMLGSFAVGKTSLISRFVRSIFSDKYLTTVGVKIDKKSMKLGDRELTLMLWDLAGEDEFLQIKMSYLRGSSGYFLVADGTRGSTLDKAIELQKKVEKEIGIVPFILLINKSDLAHEWEVKEADLQELAGQGWVVLKTSAKEGTGVEQAFQALGERMLT